MLPLLAPVLSAQQAPTGVPAPVYAGDPDGERLLEPWLAPALQGTSAFGPWPAGAWTLRLHESPDGFEQATGAPPGRAALWIGSTLHLRPWTELQRRDLGALLRHELVHRRAEGQGLSRWREEALCLWAEGHLRPPQPWPADPEAAMQDRLDRALAAGTTATQAWAYRWLRAWLEGRPLPASPVRPAAQDAWQAEAEPVRVVWPPERLPRVLEVEGRRLAWRPAARFAFQGEVRFGAGLPVGRLQGEVELEAVAKGWRLTWTTDADGWIAAATEGELGAGAPFEARRALAAVLGQWLKAHPRGNHPDGSFCPLTHCAVIRGSATEEGARAVREMPPLELDPALAVFTGSKGGVALSPREVWGGGPAAVPAAILVPGDPWGSWTRVLSAAQARALKRAVPPGLKAGQKGMRLGASGPYPVEALRLESGRRFGWTLWPSNACEGTMQADGSLKLQGHGWGHNAGLCLATALYRARQGWTAEAILAEAFGTGPANP